MLGLSLHTEISQTDDPVKTDLLVREWLEDVADYIFNAFLRWVPVDSGRTLSAVDKGNVEKTPYGYKVSVGVEPIENAPYGESPFYPRFVHEGTGIYKTAAGNLTATHGLAPYGTIRPANGNIMAFEKEGEGTVFTRFVKGQVPQPYAEAIEEETEIYLKAKRRELAVILGTSLIRE